ncbi:MAG: hypothetical protein AAGC44_03915 [Planctomycetota bacterium]
MTTPSPVSQKKPAPLSPDEAYSAARQSWASSLVIAGIGLVLIMGILLKRDGWAWAAGAAGEPINDSSSMVGGLMVGVAVAWLALLGPIVLVLRSYCFFRLPEERGGRPVEPGSYLKGMASVWGVLTVGAMLALIGAAIEGQVMPGGLVALVAVMVLGMVQPNKRALGLS